MFEIDNGDRPAKRNRCGRRHFICVKLYDIETAAEVIKPLLGDNTMVISVLNGVDGPQRLERIIGLGRVIGGAAYASAYI